MSDDQETFDIQTLRQQAASRWNVAADMPLRTIVPEKDWSGEAAVSEYDPTLRDDVLAPRSQRADNDVWDREVPDLDEDHSLTAAETHDAALDEEYEPIDMDAIRQKAAAHQSRYDDEPVEVWCPYCGCVGSVPPSTLAKMPLLDCPECEARFRATGPTPSPRDIVRPGRKTTPRGRAAQVKKSNDDFMRDLLGLTRRRR